MTLGAVIVALLRREMDAGELAVEVEGDVVAKTAVAVALALHLTGYLATGAEHHSIPCAAGIVRMKTPPVVRSAGHCAQELEACTVLGSPK